MKITPLIISLLISLSSFSQISTVEKQDESKTIGQINLYNSTGLNGTATFQMASIIDGKQYYYLGWQNQDYSTITDIASIMFHATPNEIDSLFDMFKTILKTGEKQTLNLGDKRLTVSRIAKDTIWFYTSDGFFDCNAAALHALFGKPWNKKQWKSFLKS
ncbi:hypothetical protein N9H89_00890 [Flavobacteriaceae bacterium]|nr:hypothetical protein [Flavobacteriaceae bacterium]